MVGNGIFLQKFSADGSDMKKDSDSADSKSRSKQSKSHKKSREPRYKKNPNKNHVIITTIATMTLQSLEMFQKSLQMSDENKRLTGPSTFCKTRNDLNDSVSSSKSQETSGGKCSNKHRDSNSSHEGVRSTTSFSIDTLNCNVDNGNGNDNNKHKHDDSGIDSQSVVAQKQKNISITRSLLKSNKHKKSATFCPSEYFEEMECDYDLDSGQKDDYYYPR